MLQHARVPVLTEVLSGVEENEQDDDRPRPDRVAAVAPPEDRLQNDETRRDDQARHGELEKQPLAADGPTGERFFGLSHRMKSIREVLPGAPEGSASVGGWPSAARALPATWRRGSTAPPAPLETPGDDGLAALFDVDVLDDDVLLTAGFHTLQRSAPGLRHVKEPRRRIREACVLDRRETAPHHGILGHAPEELHTRVMGRGDLVRDHFLEARCRTGGHGRKTKVTHSAKMGCSRKRMSARSAGINRHKIRRSDRPPSHVKCPLSVSDSVSTVVEAWPSGPLNA